MESSLSDGNISIECSAIVYWNSTEDWNTTEDWNATDVARKIILRALRLPPALPKGVARVRLGLNTFRK